MSGRKETDMVSCRLQNENMALWRNLVETHLTQNEEGVILVLVRIQSELQKI